MKTFEQELINSLHILKEEKTNNLLIQETSFISYQDDPLGLKELPALQPAESTCIGKESSPERDCKGCPFIKNCLGKKK